MRVWAKVVLTGIKKGKQNVVIREAKSIHGD